MPQQVRKPDIHAPSLLTRLARDNRRMGIRLAQLEFRELRAELANPSVFDLKIDFASAAPPQAPTLPFVLDRYAPHRLPVLNVPLGRIAWTDQPDSLPVIGVLCPDLDHKVLRHALLDLLATHHAKPFAKLLFMCQALRPIPFLGRYGFAYEFLGNQGFENAARRAGLRYGAGEIRNLIDGKVIWRRPPDRSDSAAPTNNPAAAGCSM